MLHFFISFKSAEKIAELWNGPNAGWKLLGTGTEANVTNAVRWIGKVIDSETNKMRKELSEVKRELSELLDLQEPGLERRRRVAASALAIGAVSALGGGVALGTSLACTLKGIFGTCTNWGKKNSRAIKELVRTTDFLEDELHRWQKLTNGKFFLVASELR